jgi:hypothetical protein
VDLVFNKRETNKANDIGIIERFFDSQEFNGVLPMAW